METTAERAEAGRALLDHLPRDRTPSEHVGNGEGRPRRPWLVGRSGLRGQAQHRSREGGTGGLDRDRTSQRLDGRGKRGSLVSAASRRRISRKNEFPSEERWCGISGGGAASRPPPPPPRRQVGFGKNEAGRAAPRTGRAEVRSPAGLEAWLRPTRPSMSALHPRNTAPSAPIVTHAPPGASRGRQGRLEGPDRRSVFRQSFGIRSAGGPPLSEWAAPRWFGQAVPAVPFLLARRGLIGGLSARVLFRVRAPMRYREPAWSVAGPRS
jgi:hypothetical protein